MYVKLFQPMELINGSDARITLIMKFLGGTEFKYIYDHPGRSYDAIYYELQKDYDRHGTENTFTIRYFGIVNNKSVNQMFYSFDRFLTFLKDNNLMEKHLLETREYRLINL